MEQEEIILESYPDNLLQKDWSKRRCYLKKPAQQFYRNVHELEVRDDDVWIVTLPKCGTTWMQELTWLVMNDYDFEAAKSEHLELRSPFLEFSHLLNGDGTVAAIDQLKSPRLIKVHLSLPLLPKQLWKKKPKTIYVYRNPLDAWVSSYYHGLNIGSLYGKQLDEHINDYLHGQVHTQQPFEHAMEFFQLRHEPWIYYTSFERMKLNLSDVIENVCKFLNKSINEQQMQKMLQHLSFEEMKKNPTTNHLWEQERVRKQFKNFVPINFVRKGEVNGYKQELQPQTIAKAQEFIQKKLGEHLVTLDELLLLK